MKLKNCLPLLFIVALPMMSQAQRQTDLTVSVVNPPAVSFQQTNSSIGFLLSVKNLGPANILPTDTIGIDIILDGDTLMDFATNSRPIFKRTGFTINAGDSIDVTQFLVFQSSFEGTVVNTCLRPFPLNAVADTVNDPNLGNNTDCVSLDFTTPASVATTGNQGVGLSVAPVPANGFIRIACPDADKLSIRITDLTGRSWLAIENYKPDAVIPVDTLPSGLYQVTAISKYGSQRMVTRFAKR